MKICSRCKQNLLLIKFKVKNITSNQYSSWCIDCKKTYDREKLQEKRENKIYLLEVKNKRSKKKIISRVFIKNYLTENPCVDCGENDLILLEFDHKPNSNKIYNVSEMVGRDLSLETIKLEIAKCEVRCGNCHRHKTIHQLNSWKSSYCLIIDCKWKKFTS
jgi:hypothetical protein